MGIVDDRRALHRIPELDSDLPETLSYLQTALSGVRCQLLWPATSSLCAFFDFGKAKTLAFRADMDALPLREANGLSYASRHKGQMHACGHDGHMAILLELARRVNAMADCCRNILLVFQPAEETVGGARGICESGIFEQYRVEALFGLHLWPALKQGVVFSKPGAMMSRSCEVDVDFQGKSAHVGRSWEGIDALEAATVFLSRAYDMERSWPGEDFRLLKFGFMKSGTVRNAISDHTRLEGCLRTYDEEIFRRFQQGLCKIGAEVEAQFGCGVQIHFSEGCHAVWNPRDLHDKVQTIVPFEALPEPSLTTEDFSCYQQYLPAMFFFLGIGDGITLHSPHFDFDDEAVLPRGADFFEQIIRRWF